MLKLKLQYFGHLMWRVDSLEKTDAGRDWGQEEKGTTEDGMAGWHHWLDGRESEWTPGVGDGQGGLVCCDSWGRKESDTTEQLNWTELTEPVLCNLLNINSVSAFTKGSVSFRMGFAAGGLFQLLLCCSVLVVYFPSLPTLRKRKRTRKVLHSTSLHITYNSHLSLSLPFGSVNLS